MGLSLTLLLALLSLAAVLAFAVARPRGWPEAFAAVPAVALLIAVGAISLHDAANEAAQLSSVVVFLGAVLVLAKMCDDEGLFEAAGAAMARANSGSHRLLRQVFVIAAIITAALSLDATVVLLTPVVLTTVRRLRAPVRPHAYATAHLANAASLLLPVSNLTNLLAFHAANVSFIRFTALMTLPWLAAVATVYVVFRVFFRRDLSVQPEPQQDETGAFDTGIRVGGGGADAGRVRGRRGGGRGARMGGSRRRRRDGYSRTDSSAHLGDGDRARGERALPGLRVGVGRGGAGRDA